MPAHEIQITHVEEFAAAHRLCSSALGEAENRELYGPCYQLHGHNYRLEVSVVGPLDSRTGMVMDLNRLMQWMRRDLIEAVDHKYLNEDVPFLNGRIPTAEVLAVAFWEMLAPRLAGGPLRLARVRVVESQYNSATYEGRQV